MVQYAFARGFKPAARHFHTGPSVVRKRNNVIKKIERRFFYIFANGLSAFEREGQSAIHGYFWRMQKRARGEG